MWPRRLRHIVNLPDTISQIFAATAYNCLCYSTGSTVEVLQRKLRKSERKPLVKSINELKREARLRKDERQLVHEISLKPPENGLLVKGLVPLAYDVYAARDELLRCASGVAKNSAVHVCCVCGEVHIGHVPHKIRTCNVAGSAANKEHNWTPGGLEHVLPVVESFHLYDRIGRAVSHSERLLVDRIPAIVELCIQAGVDIPEYPTRRRNFPAYSVARRIIDFEKRFPKDVSLGKDIDTRGFWCNERRWDHRKSTDLHFDSIQAVAVQGMEAWEKLRSGAAKLMETYAVLTCGYCSEVQVGPKGHRVRNCQAYKHQMRDGQHAWQKATVDDLIPPIYAWHVRDVHSSEPLVHHLKSFYGILPAAVELFLQAGAPVSDNYAGLMREDVAVPEQDEIKLVV